jgi:hypothetical protein
MLRGRRFAAVAALVATMLHGSRAAASPDEHRYQTWLAAFAHGPVKGNFWVWSDFQLRTYESFEPTTAILRPGLTWRARPNLFLTAGYAWIPGWTRDEELPSRAWGELDFVDEHRTWQQLLWTPHDERTGLSAMVRGRLEQRFRPGQSDVGSRARILWRGHGPLTRDRRWIAVVWNELFLGLNDTAWGQTRGFDQNRAFGGFGYVAIPRRVRLELGYTNKWTARRGPDAVEHIVALNTFFSW